MTVQPKTNAMRALDARGISYEANWYDPAIKSAVDVAAALGVAPAEVYKTLVMVRSDGGRLLLMVPGDQEVDLRLAAREIAAKSVRMASRADAERWTGLQTGGIGALALLGKRFDVYIDRKALDRETILVNGGRRGLNLRVRVSDLVAAVSATPIETSGPLAMS